MENEKKPKKRSLRLLSVLTVVLLLVFMVVPAFASEYDGVEQKTIKAGTYRFNEELSNYPDIGAGTYTYNLPISGEGYQEGSGSYSFVGSAFEINMNSGSNNHNFATLSVKVESTNPDYSPFVQYPYIHQVFSYDEWKVPPPVVFTVLEDTDVAEEFYTWFMANAVLIGSFHDSVTSGLTVVIEWVGTVVSSLFSGELSGLLPIVAIPVAVTLLVLAIYFIRRSIWGA